MALVLNGVNQYLTEDFATGVTDPVTIAIKFKSTFSTSSNSSPLSVCNTVDSLLGFVGFLFFSGTGLVGRAWSDAPSTTSGQPLTDDFWHSAVLVNDGAGTLSVYLDGNPAVTVSVTANPKGLDKSFIGARLAGGNDSSVDYFFSGKLAYYRRTNSAISAANAASYNSATSEAEVNAVITDGANLIDDATVSGSASALAAFGAPTYDTDTPLTVSATPTITNINTTNEVTPGATATLAGTNLTNATGVTIGSVSQAGFTVVSDTSVTFTGTRGGNPYNQDLTATLLSPDGNATITVQQVPEAGTFAVTAASPNTTDDASLWTGLVDTATGDPVTVVDGDQAWVNTLLDGLAISPDGTITASETGTFTVQFWRASEGVWGSDQTVSFTLPAEATDNWPFGKAINPIATKNWTWGSRHPMTGMRVRIFK